jgi:type III secretion protein Q
VTSEVPPALVLALTLCPDRAAALASRLADPAAADGVRLAPGGRLQRLASLGEILRARAFPPRPARGTSPAAARLAVELAVRAAARTEARGAAERETGIARAPSGVPPARSLLEVDAMLPFDLPCASPAAAEIDLSVLEAAARAARAAESGLASVLGGDVRIRARLLPAVPSAGASTLVAIELTALAGHAQLAVECSFAARLAERVGGGEAAIPAATALSPAERTVLELAVLAALDGLAAEPGIEEALGARLSSATAPPQRPLCVELTVSAAGTEGRALLLVPERAIRALRGHAALPLGVADAAVEASLRSGRVSIDGEELGMLRAGDVLLLDEPPGDGASLELPDGTSVEGRLSGDDLEIDDVLPASPGGGEGLPVMLDVELATVRVPVRELARIVPGAVLALGIDRRGLVTLRIGSRAVARGELVEVDGAVGVRILGRREAG